jgi:hypothetical protein
MCPFHDQPLRAQRNALVYYFLGAKPGLEGVMLKKIDKLTFMLLHILLGKITSFP